MSSSSYIFEDSSPSIRSEVDLFKIPPTDTSIEKSNYIEFSPTTNVQENTGQIEFNIQASSNYYRDLKNSFIYVVFQIINTNGSNLKTENVKPVEYEVLSGSTQVTQKPYVEPDDLVSTVNGFASSMFSQCDVYLNDTLVSQANNLYPYRAIFENTINYGNDHKLCQGALGMFYEEKAPDVFTVKDNDGFKKRYNLIKGSRKVEVISRPCADIFNIDKYLLTGTNLKIKFTRS